MPLPKLEYSYSNKTLLIYLNSLESRNAFDIDMAEELSQILSDEKPSSIYLTNRGSYFCAGGNLKFYQKLKTKEEGLKINCRIKTVLDDLFQLAIPKVCFVNGPCYGGGVELMSCFDKVISSPHSLFGLWQKRIGLSFGWGGGSRLLHRLELQPLQQWLDRAETVSAYEAKKRGLIDDIVLQDKALEVGISLIEQIDPTLKREKKVFPNEEEIFSSLWMGEKHRKILERF